MNLSLGFPEFPGDLALATMGSLQTVVHQFEAAHAEPDSPIRAIHHQPAAEAVFEDLPADVDPRLRAALERHGIARLYSHQAEALREIEAGSNVAIVTPTASGKTLCYNLPVLNLLLTDEGARAMYIFPTKALAEEVAGGRLVLLNPNDMVTEVLTTSGLATLLPMVRSESEAATALGLQSG